MSSLGQRLKQLRKQNDLSQKDVAKHLQITVSALSQYETDKRTPKNEALLTLARLYNTSTDYLLGFNPAEHYSHSSIPYKVSSPARGYYDDASGTSILQQKQRLISIIDSLPADKQVRILTALAVLLQD